MLKNIFGDHLIRHIRYRNSLKLMLAKSDHLNLVGAINSRLKVFSIYM